MKKYIVLLAVAIMAFSLPLTAQAQDQAELLSMLDAKVVAADGGLITRAGRAGSEGLVIPYAVNQDGFASGIAIFNSDSEINTITIASFDCDGTLVDSGSFSLMPGTNKVDMIGNLMDGGQVPGWGFTGIFATGKFIADRFVFQGAGAGFGELTMESQAY